MSILEELKATTESLDRILAKLEKVPPSDKPKLETAVRAAQSKVQDILLAIQKLS